MTFQRPFQSEEIVKLYKAFRPHQPQEVFDCIINYYKDKHVSNPFTLAVDIGCGPGISTIPLANHFHKVIGIDISEVQISQANSARENVSYKVGRGEDLHFCEDESVDLVIMMAAFHWLDRERIYNELRRVLKPNGVIAICTYWHNFDLGHPEATKALYSEVLQFCFYLLFYIYCYVHVFCYTI